MALIPTDEFVKNLTSLLDTETDLETKTATIENLKSAYEATFNSVSSVGKFEETPDGEIFTPNSKAETDKTIQGLIDENSAIKAEKDKIYNAYVQRFNQGISPLSNSQPTNAEYTSALDKLFT